MNLTWNLVTHNLEPHDELRRQCRHRIAKLERYLQHIPPEAVHLQIRIERHGRPSRATAALTLRVPSNVLHREKTAASPVHAFELAVKGLVEEVESLKANLQDEEWWRRRERGPRASATRPARFSDHPLPPGQGPQNAADMARDVIERYYPQLLRFARRRIHRDERAGLLIPGLLAPASIADEVARVALSEPGSRPPGTSYRLWLYSLVRAELRRRCRRLAREARENVSLETPARLPRDTEREWSNEADLPAEAVERELEPATAEPGELLADPRSQPPDEVAADHDFVAYLERAASGWPRLEHDVFELHFLEGLDPTEIAVAVRREPAEVQAVCTRVQGLLRDLIREAVDSSVQR